MKKELPLLDRIYADPCYTDVCRLIGYKGCVYRQLWDVLKPAIDTYGQRRVESATAHLLTYERQFAVNPPPLAPVTLRSDVREYCWMLLGPPPEKEDAFYRHPDGTPRERPAKEEPKPAEPQP